VPNNTIQTELRSFLSCIEEKKISVASGVVGVKTVHMIEIARKSLAEKKTLHLDLSGALIN